MAASTSFAVPLLLLAIIWTDSNHADVSCTTLDRKIQQLSVQQRQIETNLKNYMDNQIAELYTDITNRIRCPQDFQYDANTDICIRPFTEQVGWNEARDRCEGISEGVRLAVLDSEEKRQFASSLTPGRYFWWLGGRRESGSFKWLTGDDITEGWDLHQPDGGNCIFYYTDTIRVGNTYSGLRDVSCTGSNYYVCEVPII